MIGSDVSFILWAEIKKVSLEDVLKRLEETSFFLAAGKRLLRRSVVKNQRVTEIKCIAAGEPYCEWEIT